MRIQMISNLESPLINEALRLYHQRFPSVTWVMGVQNSQDTVKRIQREKCGIGLCLLSRPMGLEPMAVLSQSRQRGSTRRSARPVFGLLRKSRGFQ
ncbi:putative transcriptional regulator, LysR family protein (plasmid) [Sinorhizobium meliloti SM11]|uniref:Transcriptional regulator, LysR family protein n=1 Tax=Sinorhizobium meliloti (strain SM11) TaxID=707241 RepID=F7XJK7_SINMM|nr:putative transcriptional regulator, LysR family protein [Sinorhizobium meliloti SM11]